MQTHLKDILHPTEAINNWYSRTSDEPELHPDATLQRNVMKFLKDMTNRGRQIFIATHSLEMISHSSTDNFYHLSQFHGSSQLQNMEKEKENIGL